MNKRITVAFLCALALAAYGTASGLETGHAAPNCALASFGTEQPPDVSQFRGKVVYVDFWASWCGPCAQSFPFMNDLDREFRGKGLQVLGISVDQKPDDAKKFLGKHPADFTVALDSGGQCPRSFEVQGMPSSYLIDRNGIVRYVHLGFRQGDAETIRSKIETLLAEKS